MSGKSNARQQNVVCDGRNGLADSGLHSDEIAMGDKNTFGFGSCSYHKLLKMDW